MWLGPLADSLCRSCVICWGLMTGCCGARQCIGIQDACMAAVVAMLGLLAWLQMQI